MYSGKFLIKFALNGTVLNAHINCTLSLQLRFRNPHYKFWAEEPLLPKRAKRASEESRLKGDIPIPLLQLNTDRVNACCICSFEFDCLPSKIEHCLYSLPLIAPSIALNINVSNVLQSFLSFPIYNLYTKIQAHHMHV